MFSVGVDVCLDSTLMLLPVPTVFSTTVVSREILLAFVGVAEFEVGRFT